MGTSEAEAFKNAAAHETYKLKTQRSCLKMSFRFCPAEQGKKSNPKPGNIWGCQNLAANQEKRDRVFEKGLMSLSTPGPPGAMPSEGPFLHPRWRSAEMSSGSLRKGKHHVAQIHP